jgi:hypothetical protein
LKQEEIDAVMKLFNNGKVYKEIADELDMSVDQVKRRVYASKNGTTTTPPQTGYQLGGDAKDRKILMQADEIARLKNEIKNQHKANIEAENINNILGTLVNAVIEPPTWLINTPKKNKSKEVLMTSWADWHVGETVYKNELNGINEYNLDIVEARVKRLVARTIDLAQNYGPGQYPGAVINLLGDMVSGGLHEEHRKTDEAPPLECALKTVELLVWGLRQMADVFGHLYVPCVCGNHGRMTVKPEFKQYVKKNWDYLIYKMLEREFVNDKRVIIDVRESNEVYYNVYGTSYMVAHGDMLGVKGGDGIIGSIGPISRGEVKTRGRMASSNMPYDMLLIGHWHQPLWLPRVIVANTLKGYCEYSKNQLGAIPTQPSQPLWFHHPKYGITSRWEVMVDEPTVKQDPIWVSVFDPVKVA